MGCLLRCARYANRYVAINNRQVVDHDADQRTLYLRVRQRYGSDVVVILWADWEKAPGYEMRNLRLERST